jgi:uncharacterized membrane-anchored protein YjiN (DUF445 family)
MIGNKHKASFILGAVSCGFILSYPYHHTFTGGLLTRGFGAAMIGGLADWFAVSALFRRPLGIPFRTAIIPRNRERIFKALIDMVENEILMKENIKQRLDEYDLSAIVVHFTNSHGGRRDFKKVLYRFVQELFIQIKPEEISPIVHTFVESNMKQIKVSPYIISACSWLMENKYDDKIIDIIIDQLIVVLEDEKLLSILMDVFAAVSEKYERGMSRRRIFNQVMNLSPKQLASAAQQGLKTIIAEMKLEDSGARLKGKAFLRQFVLNMKTDSVFEQKVENWVQEHVIDKFSLGTHLAKGFIDVYGKMTMDSRQTIRGMEPLLNQIDKLVTDFADNQEERAKFSEYLKEILRDWIDIHHDEVGRIVRDSLNSFTDDMLVNFIENKMGNDLQMIRINGSIVGGLVGVIIYLLTFWIL